jgi:hypothetical protein
LGPIADGSRLELDEVVSCAGRLCGFLNLICRSWLEAAAPAWCTAERIAISTASKSGVPKKGAAADALLLGRAMLSILLLIRRVAAVTPATGPVSILNIQVRIGKNFAEQIGWRDVFGRGMKK